MSIKKDINQKLVQYVGILDYDNLSLMEDFLNDTTLNNRDISPTYNTEAELLEYAKEGKDAEFLKDGMYVWKVTFEKIGRLSTQTTIIKE